MRQTNVLKITKQQLTGIIAIGVFIIILFMIPRIGQDVKTEQIVVNQFPFTGTIEVWNTPGLRGQWFGRVEIFYKTNQVWFNELTEKVNEKGEVIELIPGRDNPSFPITYSDKGKGFVLGSVRIELPMDEKKMRLIKDHYGSERRLFEELVKPTVGKVILACGPLMTSLESVAEKRNDLIQYATDQLNSGIYKTRAITVERINTITNEREKIQQAEIVRDDFGNPLRNERSPFEIYGLTVSQFAVADLKYEKATNDQISKQRQADMEIITAKAEAAKAIQETIKIEEQGKQNAAGAKWAQEAIKATEVTKAQQAFEVATLQAKEAEQIALKVKAEGDAKAFANRALVAAGLTPLERATIDKETKIGVAQALSGLKLPSIITMGGSGAGGSNQALDAIGLRAMFDLVDKVSGGK